MSLNLIFPVIIIGYQKMIKRRDEKILSLIFILYSVWCMVETSAGYITKRCLHLHHCSHLPIAPSSTCRGLWCHITLGRWQWATLSRVRGGAQVITCGRLTQLFHQLAWHQHGGHAVAMLVGVCPVGSWLLLISLRAGNDLWHLRAASSKDSKIHC